MFLYSFCRKPFSVGFFTFSFHHDRYHLPPVGYSYPLAEELLSNRLGASVFLQHIKQTALSAALSVSLLGLKPSGFAKIIKCPPNGGLRQLQFFGNRWNSGPAFAVLVGSVRKIDIDGSCAVRKLGAVNGIKPAHRSFPPYVCYSVLRLLCSPTAERHLSLQPFLSAPEAVWAAF